jgi:hypothetical protein
MDTAFAQVDEAASQKELIPIAEGWARNSVNAVIFRKNSVTTYQQNQFTAFYDADGFMILAKRQLRNRDWKIHKTRYKANVEDAHNAISIAVDGDGFSHVSWGLHGQKLIYSQSREPGSLELTEKRMMTGENEEAVTYPQFYRLANGDLLFMYRDGSSGDGDIMLNRYNTARQKWTKVAHPLIDGQGKRNAYVNSLAVDQTGGWHISWTWRETWDVATNHDIMYAYSVNEGKSWMKSNGEKYELPITIDNAEIAYKIPQKSELINQTSMTVDSEGRPVIATYWKPPKADSPQYHIVWKEGTHWRISQVTNRKSSFSLSGGGTKRIPISRPQIIAGDNHDLYIIYRDFERGGGISVARSTDPNYKNWNISDIYTASVGMWEPTLDHRAWKNNHVLYLFVQKVGQGDGETLEEIPPQKVYLLKWIPELYIKQE